MYEYVNLYSCCLWSIIYTTKNNLNINQIQRFGFCVEMHILSIQELEEKLQKQADYEEVKKELR